MKKDELCLPEEYNIESLYGQVKGLVDAARLKAFKQVNLIQIITNLLIGKSIIDDEQEGNARAKYGKAILKKLSVRLTEEYGRGFSVDNLENMRKFYLKFGDRISEALLRKLENQKAGRFVEATDGFRISRNGRKIGVC